MRKNFFSGMPLQMIIEIIQKMAQMYNLFPSREVFARLYELEKEGQDVESVLPKDIFGGALLKAYREFKFPEGASFFQRLLPKSKVVRSRESSATDYEFAIRLQAASPEGQSVFEWIRSLHRQYVPVFTMMHAAGHVAMANAYREWLFAQYA